MIKFSSIEQFRNVIKEVQEFCKRKNGLRDETGELVLVQPKTWILPKLNFRGTVKLHGTNSAVRVSVDEPMEVGFQSRNRTLNIENDNAGFALWASQYLGDWRSNAEAVKRGFDLWIKDVSAKEVLFFGEWCGGNIQKGVALSGLPKMFVIFEVWIIGTDGKTYYPDIEGMEFYIPDVYNIFYFKNWTIDVDFENPQIVQNDLIKITDEVEAECPVGKRFGVSGVGEGVVWSVDLSPTTRIRFKVKGEKHSASKVKTLASVDVDKLNTINEFVVSVLTEARLNQGIEYLKEMNIPIDIKSTGDFLKWIAGDVIKEETDTLVENQLEVKDVMKVVSTKARQWFLQSIS